MKVFGTSDCDFIEVLLVTQNYDFDIGSGFAGGSPAVRSLCPTTEAFHSKNPVDRSAVMPYEGQNFLLCSV
jgi:hypothetical protein